MVLFLSGFVAPRYCTLLPASWADLRVFRIGTIQMPN